MAAEGKCVTCAGPREDPAPRIRCRACAKKLGEAVKAWASRARVAGRCTRCGKEAALHRSRELCDPCAEVNRNGSRRNGLRLVEAGKCRRCGAHRAADGWDHPKFCAECFDKRQEEAAVLYGLTAEEARRLRSAPCSVCGRPASRSKKGANHIDHDHEHGVVRGTLCHGCNVSEGLLGGDPARMRALADYVEKHALRAKESGQ